VYSLIIPKPRNRRKEVILSWRLVDVHPGTVFLNIPIDKITIEIINEKVELIRLKYVNQRSGFGVE
jgi:hypothetical protein